MGAGASAHSDATENRGHHQTRKHVSDYEAEERAAKVPSEILSGPGYEKSWLTVERVKHRSNVESDAGTQQRY